MISLEFFSEKVFGEHFLEFALGMLRIVVRAKSKKQGPQFPQADQIGRAWARVTTPARDICEESAKKSVWLRQKVFVPLGNVCIEMYVLIRRTWAIEVFGSHSLNRPIAAPVSYLRNVIHWYAIRLFKLCEPKNDLNNESRNEQTKF